MPNIKQIWTESLVAGADLSGNQFYGVKFSADRTVILQTAVTLITCGMLLNKPESGETALVGIVGRFKGLAGETFVAGDQIRIHSDGKCMVFVADTDTTAFAVGVCSEGGVSGDNIEGFFNFATQDRGEE